MGKSTISMAIFHSYVWHNQRITIGYKNRNVPMAHHLLRILHLVWYPCAIQMGRHGVQDCHMSISKNIQMITFDYMTACDHTWLYMIIYYMTIYDYIWLYVHLCIATSKRIDKSVRDGIDDPFPYFPDFQLVYPFGPFYACVSRLMLTICWATGASCFPTWPWDIMRQPLLDLKKRQHASVQVVQTC